MSSSRDTSDTSRRSAMAGTDPAARLAALREEAAALEAELGIEPGSDGASPNGQQTVGTGSWWRSLVAGVCIVLLAVVAPLTVLASWAHDQVSDTDRYVATVAPLAKNPAVQDAVSTRITEELLARLDIQAVTSQAVDALASRGCEPMSPRV